jgi:hypothetical protein
MGGSLIMVYICPFYMKPKSKFAMTWLRYNCYFFLFIQQLMPIKHKTHVYTNVRK